MKRIRNTADDFGLLYTWSGQWQSGISQPFQRRNPSCKYCRTSWRYGPFAPGSKSTPSQNPPENYSNIKNGWTYKQIFRILKMKKTVTKNGAIFADICVTWKLFSLWISSYSKKILYNVFNSTPERKHQPCCGNFPCAVLNGHLLGTTKRQIGSTQLTANECKNCVHFSFSLFISHWLYGVSLILIIECNLRNSEQKN